MGSGVLDSMTHAQALEALAQGKRINRSSWKRGSWVRRVNLYADAEFSLTEKPGSLGTWMPFDVIKTVDNKLMPWRATQSDILANDWKVAE